MKCGVITIITDDNKMKRVTTTITALLLLTITAFCQTLVKDTIQKVDIPISVVERNTIIQSALDSLTRYYVSSDVAALMKKTIEERNKKGIYAKINKGFVFSDTLTKHLREISNDEHLGLIFHADAIPLELDHQPTPEESERFKRFAASQNYGFEKAERLQGNIGYMELNGFTDWGIETAIAAMNFLANTDALIIDLRYNEGGTPGLIQLICSYFFETPVHLNTIYWRENNRVKQYWTMPYVSGNKYLNKSVYILTSKNTFSAPEEFAYDLQALKRATIIGSKTKGGANAGKVFRINDHFDIYIPIGKAINPTTGKNWEGGVIPDIEVASEDALKKAHIVALQKLIGNAISPQSKTYLQSVLQEIE